MTTNRNNVLGVEFVGDAVGLALDLDTVKADLRITGTELDSVLTDQYIPAADAWAQNSTKRAIRQQTVKQTMQRFPDYWLNYTIFLRAGVVSAVAGIDYVANGVTETLTGPSTSPAGTDYQEDLTSPIARLMPARGTSWPTVDTDAISPIVVTYTAGYGNPAQVPADLRRAMVAHVYGAMELDGLLTIRSGFDMDHADKLLSHYRTPFA